MAFDFLKNWFGGERDLSKSDLVGKVFRYEDPEIPHKLKPKGYVTAEERAQLIVESLSGAKEVRFLGFDHEVDLMSNVQKEYVKATERGTRVSIIYHPNHGGILATKEIQQQYEEFIKMFGRCPNTRVCPIQPSAKKFKAETQREDIPWIGVSFENGLYYALKTIDDKILTIAHHFSSTSEGAYSVILKSEKIPGIEEGFHKDFDMFFTDNPPYILRPKGGIVIANPGNGNKHKFEYNPEKDV